MEKEKQILLNKVLRILVVVGFIVLAVLCIYYKFDDCNQCRFEYEGKELSAKEFMDAYYDKCFSFNLGLGNVTINKGWGRS